MIPCPLPNILSVKNPHNHVKRHFSPSPLPVCTTVTLHTPRIRLSRSIICSVGVAAYVKHSRFLACFPSTVQVHPFFYLSIQLINRLINQSIPSRTLSQGRKQLRRVKISDPRLWRSLRCSSQSSLLSRFIYPPLGMSSLVINLLGLDSPHLTPLDGRFSILQSRGVVCSYPSNAPLDIGIRPNLSLT